MYQCPNQLLAILEFPRVGQSSAQPLSKSSVVVAYSFPCAQSVSLLASFCPLKPLIRCSTRDLTNPFTFNTSPLLERGGMSAHDYDSHLDPCPALLKHMHHTKRYATEGLDPDGEKGQSPVVQTRESLTCLIVTSVICSNLAVCLSSNASYHANPKPTRRPAEQ